MNDSRALMLPHIRKLNTYHGVDPTDVMAERAGIPADRVIRLNGNENPYGPSPKVLEALGSFQNYNHYPDPDQRRLREILSDYLDVPPDHIVAGNGSDELIDLLLRIFVGVGDNIIIPSPTFGMYAFSSEICGGEALSVPRDENFEIDVEAIKLAVTPKSKACFFASPNNPTGNIATESQIRALLDFDLMVVVDETYYEFCGRTVMPLVDEYPNLVVLRTFSKWAGLAGLRIGLGVMQPGLAQTMMGMKPPYNVNMAAEVALTASLEDRPLLLERVKRIVDERDRMMGMLEKIPGIKPWPSMANFILCKLPEGRGQEIYEGLCNRGIFLRYFSGGELKDYVRASVGLPHENDAVAGALAELVGG
ncbi:MAG: histidinol-phosphate transaminase [Chloroflexi bacterium]|nr:histidinol-phosphate transaminase [Chloroflexota bacterium]MCI0824700.1 histidinol-phosphate transaminase [Chloroflexota bacterium]MCI0866121.1 histidinol-phosphate transaminase [Chloroflexota bacterium]